MGLKTLAAFLFTFLFPCLSHGAEQAPVLPSGTQFPDVSPSAQLEMKTTLANNREGYTVAYRLTGVAGGGKFRTPIGTFSLPGKDLSNGKSVTVEGWAKRGDVILSEAEYSSSGVYPELRVDKIVAASAANSFRAPLQANAATFAEDGGKYVAGNVRSVDPKDLSSILWKSVKADPALLSKVYVVRKPIPQWHPLLSHMLLFFTFKDGGAVDAESGAPVAGLTVSIEARWRDDASMSLDTAFDRTFNIIWVVSTVEDYIARTCSSSDADNRLYPFELQLSQTQKAALLRRALSLAAVNREGEFYNGRSNNCTVSMIRIINGVLPAGGRITMFDSGANVPPDAIEKSLSAHLGPGLAPLTPENWRDASVWPK